jgi:hypothetical protein
MMMDGKFGGVIAAVVGCMVMALLVAGPPRVVLLRAAGGGVYRNVVPSREISLEELSPLENGLHDEKVTQLFREESQDAAEAADAAAADKPAVALRYQEAASKAAAAAETEEALPAGFHVLKTGQKLPAGAILEPYVPQLALGFHVLQPGQKLPKGAKIVLHPQVRMSAGMRKKVATKGVANQNMLKGVHAEMRAAMSRADSDLKDAQSEMQALMKKAMHGLSAPARQQMLLGIGGWGSGEEMDNAGDWEVAMHVDKGCEETLTLRSEGNPGWKRKVQNKCDPNKIQNPMMWPFDAPGKVWLHDSTDSSKEPEKFPYDTDKLHDDVYAAEQTPDRADGIYHNENEQKDGFRRPYDAKWDFALSNAH